jgi:hypothetical protein
MYLFCTIIGVYVPHVIIEMSYNDSFNVEKSKKKRNCHTHAANFSYNLRKYGRKIRKVL